jgi:4-amino-4-deoxy-L-arabinose transferase-like glycosyltransferase
MLEGIGGLPSRVLALLVLAWLLRITVLMASGAGLQVDEAQYWDWSRQLQWGYWSKPPAIAGVIAASTGLLGDGLLGVKLLSMLLWPLSAAVLAWLAWDMAGRGQAGEHAALWSAALLLGTPAAGILGMAATTDAPLLFMWALCMAASWRALRSGNGRSALPWWALAGLAMGLGLLSKYTMAVAGAAWALLFLMHWRRHGLGLVLAGLLALAVFAPNLWWNAIHGWPTLGHTAEITVAAQTRGGSRLASVLEFLVGQLLLIGPVAIALGLLGWRRAKSLQGLRPSTHPEPAGFALMFCLPLLLVALLQSFNARTNMNWTVPALLGACLWLGLYVAPRLGRRTWWISTAAALLLPAAASLMGSLAMVQSQALHAPRHLDLWARMRGWEPALRELQAPLAAEPGLPVAATRRDLLVHARYIWRDLDRSVMAWPHEGRARHHYEQFESLWSSGQEPPRRLLVLTDAPLSDEFKRQYPRWQQLGASVSGRIRLELWLATVEP